MFTSKLGNPDLNITPIRVHYPEGDKEEVECAFDTPERATMRRLFWQQTGSLHANGSFKRYLHLFVLRGVAYADTGSAGRFQPKWYPYVEQGINDEIVPDMDVLLAVWHMTKFSCYPSHWGHFWYDVESGNRIQGSCGVYWMLLPHAGKEALIKAVEDLKRTLRIRHEWALPIDLFRKRVQELMLPYLVPPVLYQGVPR